MEDNSVIFNLNEIMRLERDRVTAEEAAVRAAAANAQAEREARLREQREQAAREQAAREQAAKERERLALEAARAEENERAAAMLRVRLEAEAAQRLADRQLELAHTAKLHELAELERKKRSSWLIAAVLIGACAASGAAYAYVLQPALRTANDRSAALDRLTADTAAQTSALSRQIEELRATQAATRAAATAQQPEAVRLAPSQSTQTKRTSIKPAVTKPKPSTEDIEENLCIHSDDPLCGLDSASTKRRKR